MRTATIQQSVIDRRPEHIRGEVLRIEAAMILQNAVVQDIVRQKNFGAMPKAQQILRHYAIELASLRRRRAQ